MPVKNFDNPLDVAEAKINGIGLPALVFYPDSVAMQIGESVSLQIFAFEVEGLNAAHIQINYEQQKLKLKSASSGELLKSPIDPGFFFEDDTMKGLLDIYTISYGIDSLQNVSGTGSLATIEFETIASGKIILEYTNMCEFVDHDDNSINIKSRLSGILDVSKNQ